MHGSNTRLLRPTAQYQTQIPSPPPPQNQKTHSPATHDVTASPADRHAAGSLFLFLHAMNASLTPAQVTATCFEAAMSTAETGGGEEEDASLILKAKRIKHETEKKVSKGKKNSFSPPSRFSSRCPCFDHFADFFPFCLEKALLFLSFSRKVRSFPNEFKPVFESVTNLFSPFSFREGREVLDEAMGASGKRV